MENMRKLKNGKTQIKTTKQKGKLMQSCLKKKVCYGIVINRTASLHL